jgi:ribosomal protein S21
LSLEVSIHEGESQESLLRRFQRMVQMSGILREVKANRHFVPKSEAARIKAKANARRKRRQSM